VFPESKLDRLRVKATLYLVRLPLNARQLNPNDRKWHQYCQVGSDPQKK